MRFYYRVEVLELFINHNAKPYAVVDFLVLCSFFRNRSRLTRSPCCDPLYKFWSSWTICTKLCMNVILLQAIPTS